MKPKKYTLTVGRKIVEMYACERYALDYLLSLGYKTNQIQYHRDSSPDFTTNDGKGWEVKKKENYCFTEKQICEMDFNTTILFVDKHKTITTAPFYELLYAMSRNYWYYEKCDDGINVLCGFPLLYPFYCNGLLAVVPFADLLTRKRMEVPDAFPIPSRQNNCNFA